MKRMPLLCFFVCRFILTISPEILLAQSNGSVVAWGRNDYGQCNVPEPNEGYIAIAAGENHGMGLKSEGMVVAWGSNQYGQCDIPGPNAGFADISAGLFHGLGLKFNGSVVAWGDNRFGQCNVPEPNSGFVAVSSTRYHSLGLKADGKIVAWGNNSYGQCNVPEPNSDFIAIFAAGGHSLGLKSDHSLTAWGSNEFGEGEIPEPNQDFVAVSGGIFSCLGLKSNGSVVGWGYNLTGECDVPEPNEDFVAIAGGFHHSLGLKSDGSIVGWGDNRYGQIDIPEPNNGFVAIQGGCSDYSLGLKEFQRPPGFYIKFEGNFEGMFRTNEPSRTEIATEQAFNFLPYLYETGRTCLGNPYQCVNGCPAAKTCIDDLICKHVVSDGTWSVSGNCGTPYIGGSWDVIDFGFSNIPDEVDAAHFALGEASPNPFNPQTTISFDLGEQGPVMLQVFDLGGRLVRSLLRDEILAPGHHEIVWNGRDEAGRKVASGTYFYRLNAGRYSEAKKMVLIN